MKMTEWFLAELESEAATSRRVLEQVPGSKVPSVYGPTADDPSFG